MEDEIYKECLARKQAAIRDGKPFWSDLAKKYRMNLEELRSKFRREYAKRGDNFAHALPKITLLDIETLPMVSFTWGIWDQNVGLNQIINDWCLLSWSAKQLFDSQMKSDVLTPKEAVARNDLRVTQSMWNIIDESDIIIAHNGNGFDFKRLNTRFLVHDLMPPRANQVIDTLEVIKRNFSLSSNKLEFIAELLVNDHKIKTDFELWKGCHYGKQAALDEMLKYNKHDVEVLEEVYIKLRPWIKGHPNLALYSGDNQEMCPNCGSINLLENGYYFTPANRYMSRRCGNCGALSRERKGDLDKEKILLRN